MVLGCERERKPRRVWVNNSSIKSPSLTKKFGQREVLKNIRLAFYPGAKIGVLGRNGSGKSTLLRIMAGIDKEFEGEAKLSAGLHGRLSVARAAAQSRQATSSAMSRRRSRRSAGHPAAVSTRSTPGSASRSSPTKWKSCSPSRPRCRTRSRLHNAWELDRQVEIAMDAMNLPPGDAEVDKLSGGERRRVALCKILLEQPDLLLLDEPTNHLDAESVAWLERHLAEYPGTVVAVTHDRYFLDNVAGWILELDRGQGHSLGRELHLVAPAEEGSAGTGRKGRLGPAKDPGQRAGMDSHGAAGPAGQEQGPHQQPTKRCRPNSSRTAKRNWKSRFRPASIWAIWSSRPRTSVKGYGDRLLIEDLSFRLPPGGIVGVIGANGVGKTTLFRMIMGLEKPDSGELRVGDDGRTGLRRSEPRRPRPRQRPSSRRSPAATTRSKWAAASSTPGRTSPASISQGTDQQKTGRQPVGRRTQPGPPGQAAAPRNERAAAGRTDQRSRRRHAAGAGRGDRQFRRLRGGDQPRSLVSRSRRHAHPGLRGGQLRPLVRRQFRDLRSSSAASGWASTPISRTASATRSCSTRVRVLARRAGFLARPGLTRSPSQVRSTWREPRSARGGFTETARLPVPR